jgi:phytoene/squalene synthetase
MRKIYHGILKKMQADNFQVFHQRYTLSKPKKVWLLLTSLAGL